ncbi:MAG: hypothetical protein B7Z40_18770 [Bosea sp. 12-68-7]|nr:MAG: hypothetical protein B7Z40_18770 [Bosea sp. 12-68-7]
MSDPGSPSDPFGRSDRTIIRPNPAGRRAPLPSRPAQAMPAAPTPYAAPAAASPGVPGGSDDWMSAAQPAPPRPTPPPGPAAGPLPGRGASAEQTRTAKYILCAAADDIVQNIPGEDRHVWTQYSMLSKFFGERVGGVRFFEELDRAKADPSVNYDLLELMHACLALGFQGIHRTSAGGAANLQMIQRNLFETLRRVKQPDPELSPRWRGQAVASQVARFKVPVWSVAALAGVAVLGLYFVFRFLLSGNAEAAATAMLSVHPKGELGIVRKVFSAPPPPVPPPPVPPKVCGAVQPPIVCQVTPNVIIVRLVDITLFEPGQAAVRAEFKPLIERIASVLETEGGAVKVVGHTDNVPIRTARFASNLQLSQARAKAVGDLLQTKLSKPDRITVEGKGADAPIADNASREGRAKNRRVEIVIQRQG